MGVLLFFGLAFEALADALQGGLIVGVEDVAEWAFGFAVALGDELHHLCRRRSGPCCPRNDGDA